MINVSFNNVIWVRCDNGFFKSFLLERSELCSHKGHEHIQNSCRER